MATSFLLRMLFAALILAGSAATAAAHAVLLSADPADRAVLSTAPGQVVLVFNEPVVPLAVRLVRPDGTGEVVEASSTDGRLLVPLPADLAEGSHVINYRVASEDGHPVAGSVVFSVGREGVTPDVNPGDPLVGRILWGLRLVLHGSLFFGVGGFFAARVLGLGPGPGRNAAVLCVVGLTIAPITLGFHGLDALGASPVALVTAHPWHAAMQTTAARSLGIAAVAFAIALAGAELKGLAGPLAAGAAVVALGASLAASGHAASASPRWLTAGALALHGIGLAVWIGALLPLAASLRDRAGGDGLIRFSRVAPAAVAAVVIGGIGLAAVQVPSPADLVDTAYGRVLAAKLAVVAGLLLIAGWNRWRLTAPALAGMTGPLRRAIALEVALVAILLATVGLWRFTPPPRAFAAVANAPAEVHLHVDAVMADITVEPGRAGPVTVSAMLLSGDFGPLNPKAVTVRFDLPGAGISGLESPATRGPDGRYVARGLVLPVPGRWTVTVEVLIDDFTRADVAGPVDLRR